MKKYIRLAILTVSVICIIATGAYAQTGVKLTDDQITRLKEMLFVPSYVEITDYDAEAPSYWEGAGLWTMQVYLYSHGQLVCSAAVDPNTMEPMRNIMGYTPAPGMTGWLNDDEISAKIQEIKNLYYDTEARMYEFTHVTESNGTTWYYYGKGLKKISAPAGSYDESKYIGADRYSAEFYYDLDCNVRFVFAYNGTEEHRYYIDTENNVGCIRYIDNIGNVYDYNAKMDFSDVPGPGWLCSLALIEPHWAGLV